MAYLAAWDCLRPWALALLIPLIGLGYGLSRGSMTRRGHGRVAFAMRLAVLALLIFAVARPRTWDEVDEVGVVFVLDVSRSVPSGVRDEALGRIERWFDKMPAHGRASLVLFARRPALEIPFRSLRAQGDDAGFTQRLRHLESRFALTETDAAAALDFASGLFPSDVARRIVLLSDGNQTTGDLEASAKGLAAAGITLDVVPLTFHHDAEVMVEGLHGPAEGKLGEPVHLRAVITSQQATTARLQLLMDGVPLGPASPVTLRQGTNVLRLAPALTQGGANPFELIVFADGDGNTANNVGRASVLVAGTPEVVVASMADHDERLAEVLEAAGLAVRRLDPRRLPDHPSGYLDIDTVVLDDVPADALSEAQILALRDAVKEMGRGLVIVGGPKSFAPGGWSGTALEEVFPVQLSTHHRRVMPKGALVIVLHSIEFDSGNTWAVRLCKAALGGLSPQDEAGVVYYSHESGEQWLIELEPLGDGSRQATLLNGVYPGDMVDFHRCFQLAEVALKGSDAAVKHIVVVSDGDPQLPDPALLQRLSDALVTTSTVCIGPHGPRDAAAMQGLAQAGGGRHYLLDPGSQLEMLPRLMFKEAATLKRASIRERRFVPITLLPQSPLLRGIEAWPSLNGYVVTGVRSGAETILLADEEHEDPLLAAWYIGLGRCVAFTSDASSRWATDWLGWERFGPFWTQVVRSAAPALDTSPFPVTVATDGLTLRIRMGARDEGGVPLTDLEPAGRVLSHGRDPIAFRMAQREAGEYVADVPVAEPGHYLVTLTFERDGRTFAGRGTGAVDYASEHRFLSSNPDALNRAAGIAGGRALAAMDDPFRQDITGAQGRRELWPTFLALAVGLLVMEIGARRLDVPWSQLLPRMSWRLRRRASSPPVAAQEPVRKTERPQPTLSRAGVGEKEPLPRESPKAPPVPKAPSEGTMERLRKAQEKAQRKRKWQ